MKRLTTFIICSLLFTGLVAQQSKIENIKLQLSQSADSLIVNYDLSGKKTAFNVKLNVTSQEGQIYKLRNVTGDVGNHIHPGKDKTITWDMKADQAEVAGHKLQVNITGKFFIAEIVKKEVWIRWLYIAAGISAATGTYTHIRSNKIYDDYKIATLTDGAENLNKEYHQMLNLRNGAFGAAGVFGIASVVLHIKKIQKKRDLAISCFPVPEGAIVGLNLTF
jgi:hypothetical protein